MIYMQYKYILLGAFFSIRHKKILLIKKSLTSKNFCNFRDVK